MGYHSVYRPAVGRLSRRKSTARKVQEYFLYFVLYCVVGWLYEVFLEVVVYRWGFSNRGILWGLICPIYGIGALTFLFCFRRWMHKPCQGWKRWLRPLLLFLGCMAVATAIELAATYLMEFTVGSWPWQTYVNYDIHFQGGSPCRLPSVSGWAACFSSMSYSPCLKNWPLLYRTGRCA